MNLINDAGTTNNKFIEITSTNTETTEINECTISDIKAGNIVTDTVTNFHFLEIINAKTIILSNIK